MAYKSSCCVGGLLPRSACIVPREGPEFKHYVRCPTNFGLSLRGVKVDGGILELIMREIEVECLPGDIPERIDVDVTDLGLNGALRVSDVPANAKVKILDGPEQVVVHVVSVKEEVVAPAAGTVEAEAAATPAEPEVLKKGKKEEEAPAE